MEERIIEQNEFIAVKKSVKVLEKKEINEAAISECIRKYLEYNKINNRSFKLDQIDCANNAIEVHLKRTDDKYSEFIDEDFDTDNEWEDLMSNIAEKAKLRYCNVPWWYFPK